jgi:hypothetical protein
VVCSTLFLCRCDVLNNDLSSIVQQLRDLKTCLGQILRGGKLSAFGSQILLWLGYLHVRVSIFYSSEPVAAAGGEVTTTLLDTITDHPDYRHVFAKSHLFLSEIFGKSYPAEELLQDVEKAPVSMRTHETFCLIANMLRYRSWRAVISDRHYNLTQHNELNQAKVEAINLDIRRMDVEFGLAVATNPSAAVLPKSKQSVGPPQANRLMSFFGASTLESQTRDGFTPESVNWPSASTGIHVPPETAIPSSVHPMKRASLQWLACYAVFLTAKILWSRILYPTVRSEETAKNAAEEIMQIALQFRKAQQGSGTRSSWSRKIPRSMLWPLPLFMAGIETTDNLHADWIQSFMNEVTCSWGGEVVLPDQRERPESDNGQAVHSGFLGSRIRVQLLMEHVRQAQDYLGCRVDVESIMTRTNMGRGSFML